jgi:ubiquinone biosynthesis protein
MRQSIVDGFFHADPHPSNFLISEDGEIIYLDFGMMGKVSEEVGEKMGLMLLYMIREDIDGIMDCLTDLGRKTEEFDRDAAREMVNEKVLLLKNTTLAQHSITKQLFKLFVELSDEGLHMPSNLALMGKSLVTMEGIGLTIYPDFRITDEYEDMVEEILKQKNSPKQLTEDFTVDLIKNKDLIRKLPSKINRKLEETKEKTVKVETSTPEINLLPTALILSSCALIAASIYNRVFLYIGLIELAYGIYLHHS